ncbi:hypothetical protein [Corynebacterium sp. HS2168-gen11]|uniref:hypothetical protein n=1 Tax=Corynebacterium sp. HS2168-gen11 TaxID=2974027 RepID=UPI00216B6672|nr:hypothetical protein [Corynebacterium sp. HS2168-gen11]MCS4534955.1 hypothetical protein [Corynebacterium sp. HS2168-gen11]
MNSVEQIQNELQRIIYQANGYINDLNRFNHSNESMIRSVITTLRGTNVGVDRQVAQTLEDVSNEIFNSIRALDDTITRAQMYIASI